MNFLMSYNMKVIIKLQKPFNDDSYTPTKSHKPVMWDFSKLNIFVKLQYTNEIVLVLKLTACQPFLMKCQANINTLVCLKQSNNLMYWSLKKHRFNCGFPLFVKCGVANQQS